MAVSWLIEVRVEIVPTRHNVNALASAAPVRAALTKAVAFPNSVLSSKRDPIGRTVRRQET
jgi:hypothetical protein